MLAYMLYLANSILKNYNLLYTFIIILFLN